MRPQTGESWSAKGELATGCPGRFASLIIEKGVQKPIEKYPIVPTVPVVPTIAPSPTPTLTLGPTPEPKPDWNRWIRNLLSKLGLLQDPNAFYAAFAVRDEGNGFKEVWVEDQRTAQKIYYTPEATTGSSVAMAGGGMLLKPLRDPDPMTTLYAGEDGWYYGLIAVLKPGDEIDKIVEAVDNAGNLSKKRLKYSYSTPDNDHPDDNHSAASAQVAAYSLPPGARSEPRVAVLGSGFDWATAQFIEQAGEPVEWVDTEFAPAIVEDYPVLVIPSGGLYGLENSPLFRARLEEYARRGGVIVAFAQQHGYEFSALPTPLAPEGGEGPGVRGYGWTEDNSCYSASLYISNYHQTLSGFDRATLSANVDGYFTAWPDEATVLLTRSKNGMPGAILYPYPPPSQGGDGGGWIIATTLYDDWGAAGGGASADSRVFLRDLLAWAVAPAALPEYRPGHFVIRAYGGWFAHLLTCRFAI